jgi:hypothetical protein
MFIQEAIKSGKPFTRDAWVDDAWMFVEENNLFRMTKDILDATLDADDILADDWFVKK